MPAPRKERSIRDDTTRTEIVVPITLIDRLDNVAEFLGTTRRAALLAALDEGCAEYERRIINAEQASRCHAG